MKDRLLYKTDIIIIAVILISYLIGYAWLLEPQKCYHDKGMVKQQAERVKIRTETKKPKSLFANRPIDLGKYYYAIDIEPGSEREDEEFAVVGKSGDNLLVKRHHDWPDISGHFEWYCNEKLTTTQQMYDYVVAHRKAILRQMQEVRSRGISRATDETSCFQDYYDDYLDDPEDEMRFPPEIFDANED